MSYIPALSWSGAMRLSQLTGDPSFAEKARREMAPFLSGEKPAIAEPYQLTSLAGHLAFADLTSLAKDPAGLKLAKAAADFILPDAAISGASKPDPARRRRHRPLRAQVDRRHVHGLVGAVARRRRRRATRVTPRRSGNCSRRTRASLQRADGLFIHAVEGPHAWGRGNGFAALGLADALQYLPATWPDRGRVLEIYRRHMRALLPHQSDDGSWRQVVDEPTSYHELTVSAMTVAAMARGVRLGWIDKSFVPAIERGWRYVVTRVDGDGGVLDVCSGTGAGPTKEY